MRYVVLFALCLLNGCAVPMVLPSHDARNLVKMSTTEIEVPSLVGRSYTLSLDTDRVVQPVGGFMDYQSKMVAPPAQTYVMSQPGLSFYEALAQTLEAQGASVQRVYRRSAFEAPATRLSLHVDHLEVHQWRTRSDGTFVLARALVRWTVDSGSMQTAELRIKLPAGADPLVALSRQLASEIVRSGS